VIASAALRCALDEWSTGSYEKIDFTQKDYRREYIHHRATWQHFEQGQFKNRCRIIATEMTNYCIKMSRVKTGADDGIEEETQDAMDKIAEWGPEYNLGNDSDEDDELPPGYD
jgi:hypothetical protein